MKHILLILFITLNISAQNKVSSDSVSLTHLAKQLMRSGKSWTAPAEMYTNAILNEFKKQMPQVPDSIWEELNSPNLVEFYFDYQVPIIIQYLSADEIKEVIDWNLSPIGQKFNAVVIPLTEDMIIASQQYSIDLAKKISQELTTKGYTNNK